MPETNQCQSALLELAQREFSQFHAQVEDLERKAQTFMTLNGLILTAGVLSAVDSGENSWSPLVRILIGAALLALLVLLGTSYRFLLKTLQVAAFEGEANSTKAIAKFRGLRQEDLFEALAAYYAEAAQANSQRVLAKVANLKNGVLYSEIAGAVFFVLVLVLVSQQI